MSLETSLHEVLQSLPGLSSLPFDVAEAIAGLSHIDLEDLIDPSAKTDRQLSATQLVADLDDGLERALLSRLGSSTGANNSPRVWRRVSHDPQAREPASLIGPGEVPKIARRRPVLLLAVADL